MTTNIGGSASRHNPARQFIGRDFNKIDENDKRRCSAVAPARPVELGTNLSPALNARDDAVCHASTGGRHEVIQPSNSPTQRRRSYPAPAAIN